MGIFWNTKPEPLNESELRGSIERLLFKERHENTLRGER